VSHDGPKAKRESILYFYNSFLFVVNADCIATSYMDHDTLSTVVAELGTLKKQLDLDTFDVRVQRLAVENKD
jgi:hypothetical protein